jgi:hypothetical protein
MRAAVPLLCVVFTSCVVNTEPDPQTSTEASALTEASESVAWEPDLGCGPAIRRASVPCDGQFLWPANQGITSAQVLLRKGPDGSDGPTYLAFVVWNHSTVGRIIRATAGRKGTDLRVTISNITATRTSGFPDHNAGSTGNVSGGKIPTPGPHIDDPLQFSPAYLAAARAAARAIHVATDTFNGYAE